MSDTQAAALLEPLMAATDEYAAAHGHPNEREAVRAAAIAFAVAVLTDQSCTADHGNCIGGAEDGCQRCAENPCRRCEMLAIWKGMQ